MKRNWLYSVPSGNITFIIEICLQVNKENIIDRIIEFDKVFIALGSKYKIYNLVNDGESIHPILKEYEIAKKKQYEEFGYKRIGPPNYSLSSFCLLNFLQNAGLNFETSRLNFQFLSEDAQQKNGPYSSFDEYLKRESIHSYENILSIVPDRFLDFKTIDEVDDYLSIAMTSYSNIWFDEINIAKVDTKISWFDQPISNKYFAYQITPNFNSFLKGLHDFIEEIGGEIKVIERSYDEITDKGYILLDGKVIFQEDIDSGKVKIPYY